MVNDYGFTYKIKNLKEIYLYIESNPEEFIEYRDNYQKMLVDKTWPKNGYRRFMPKNMNKDYYWNWSETAYYFWIRRSLDGTKEQWIKVIDEILAAYPE